MHIVTSDGEKREPPLDQYDLVQELHEVAGLLRAVRLRCEVGGVVDGSDAQADCINLADIALTKLSDAQDMIDELAVKRAR